MACRQKRSIGVYGTIKSHRGTIKQFDVAWVRNQVVGLTSIETLTNKVVSRHQNTECDRSGKAGSMHWKCVSKAGMIINIGT